jgi:hypothetical protein
MAAEAEAGATADEAQLAGYATALAEGIEAAIPRWVVRCVERRAGGLGAEAEAAGERARAEIGPQVRALLATDVDQQWTNPLAILRRTVAFPTDVLRKAGVAPVARDSFAVNVFPDDIYDLAPASFADVDPALTEAGIEWGAAKAHIILNRRALSERSERGPSGPAEGQERKARPER